jgi:hypothetical protein
MKKYILEISLSLLFLIGFIIVHFLIVFLKNN